MNLYYLSADSLSEDDVSLIRARFPKRYSRAMLCANRENGLCVIAAGVLVYRVLGVDERDLKLAGDGRPYIEGGPVFSLSHSGGVCVLAAASGRVGVDIEKLDESNLIAAPVSMKDNELQWISPAPLERFHTLWTRKESIFKAVGGYSDPMEIDALDPDLPFGLHVASSIWNGFSLSVCCEDNPIVIEPINIL